MLSGVPLSSSTALNFSSFNAFALAVGCTEAPGSAARLQCLRAVPAATIRSYTNGPSGGSFGLIVDKYVPGTCVSLLSEARLTV